MRIRIREFFIFLCGLFLGCVFYAFLGLQAASSYTDSLKINYQLEQQTMAIKAKNADNLKAAINHYRNIVDASNSTLRCFENSKSIWTISYPIIANINKYLGIGQIDGSKASEGIYRALLSNALEQGGDIAGANIELKKASKLLGRGENVEKTKEILKDILKSEADLVKTEAIDTSISK
jgi:tRNA threonylcarbamoyladenosine modification (KEOPS) complex  Pcc1 subunit